MDGSITRRGQLCWYRAPAPVLSTGTSSPPTNRPHVGYKAINDSFLIGGGIFELLKGHFRGDPYYLDLVELFRECIYNTQLGQLVDLVTAPEGVVDLSRFSVER